MPKSKKPEARVNVSADVWTAQQFAARAMLASLKMMVNRWEPDTTGRDRVMWEDACEAIDAAEAAGIKVES